jgi:hypothetical protein
MSRRVVREVSRRVVSEKVLGSANPVARWGRESKGTCLDSMAGFVFGILLFFAAFALPYYAARTEKDSKDVSKLTPVSVDQAASISGMALLQGVLASDGSLRVPKGNASGILAYKYLVEDLVTRPEKRTETHTEVQNGKDVEVTEEVTEMVEKWETARSEEQWQPLRLGPLEIDRSRAKIDLPWTTVVNEMRADQKHRESVEVVKGGIPVLLACELANGAIVDEPDFYILTSQSKEQLVAQMNTAEETNRWGLIIASVVLWTISFNLLIGPLMILINIIPIKAVGAAVRGVITFVSLIIASLMTWIVYVAVRYWWVIVIVMAAIAVWLVVALNRNRQAKPELDPEPPGPPQAQ